MNNLLEKLKTEPRRKIYVRFLVISLIAETWLFFTFAWSVGKILQEKVWIVNPLNSHVSIQNSETIRVLLLVSSAFFVGAILCFILIIYKEYHTYCINKILEKYNLEEME